jgi:hypothetical protein
MDDFAPYHHVLRIRAEKYHIQTCGQELHILHPDLFFFLLTFVILYGCEISGFLRGVVEVFALLRC